MVGVNILGCNSNDAYLSNNVIVTRQISNVKEKIETYK